MSARSAALGLWVALLMTLTAAREAAACSPMRGSSPEPGFDLAFVLAGVTGIAAIAGLWLRGRDLRTPLTTVPLILLVFHPAWTVPAGTDCGAMKMTLALIVTIVAIAAVVRAFVGAWGNGRGDHP